MGMNSVLCNLYTLYVYVLSKNVFLQFENVATKAENCLWKRAQFLTPPVVSVPSSKFLSWCGMFKRPSSGSLHFYNDSGITRWSESRCHKFEDMFVFWEAVETFVWNIWTWHVDWLLFCFACSTSAAQHFWKSPGSRRCLAGVLRDRG